MSQTTAPAPSQQPAPEQLQRDDGVRRPPLDSHESGEQDEAATQDGEARR